jgi:hypothetical protein
MLWQATMLARKHNVVHVVRVASSLVLHAS